MANVPKIFTAETEKFTESNVVEQTIRAVLAKQVEVLAGIDLASSPPLGGYLASEARPTSEILLKTSDRSEPLLVRWRFGLGRVCVFTSDAQGVWAKDWTRWDGFSQLWTRLVSDTLRKAPPGDIRLSGHVEEDRGILTVRVPAERPDQETSSPILTGLDPVDREVEIPLVRRGLGIYQGEIELTRLGPYAFRAQRKSPRGATELAYASLSRAYREEYLSHSPDPKLLRTAARMTGGAFRPDARTVFAPGRKERQHHQERWPPFVLAGLCLFLAEVFVRRI
jgi:hypothetical protein